MKYEIRRKNREMKDRKEILQLLDAAEYAVISMVDGDGVPYGIPINFAREGDRLIFHCATEGRKLECLRFHPRVSLCVVGRTRVLPGQFTTEYESVIVEGMAEIVEDERRKIDDLMVLCRKYSPGHLEAAKKAIEKSLHRTAIFEIRIESMAGKAKRNTEE